MRSIYTLLETFIELIQAKKIKLWPTRKELHLRKQHFDKKAFILSKTNTKKDILSNKRIPKYKKNVKNKNLGKSFYNPVGKLPSNV